MTSLGRVLRCGPAFVAWWVVARAAIVFWLAPAYPWSRNDVPYYWYRVHEIPQVGMANTLTEYPTPVMLGLRALHSVTAGDWNAFVTAFVIVMALLDAGFALALWRAGGSRRELATGFWIAFLTLCGPVAYYRFDVLPAVLVGWALLALARRPGVAGALLGLGAAVKLWPALLVGAPLLRLRGQERPSRLALGGFLGVGVGLALLSVAVAGWDRLVSPLTWQGARGLQVESLAATPAMLARALGDKDAWVVALSRFNAIEISGPGTALLLTASTWVTAAGLGLLVLVWVRMLRRRPTLAGIGWMSIAIVLVMIVTNKTLSPQYIVWLGAPVATTLLVSGQRRPDKPEADTARAARRAVAFAMASLVTALLTQAIFPAGYMALLSADLGAAVLLATRNVVLLLLTGWALAETLRAATTDATTGSAQSLNPATGA